MDNSAIKGTQIAYYNSFIESFINTISSPKYSIDATIQEKFKTITNNFADSLNNNSPNSYVFKHEFPKKAELLTYTTCEDINRANQIISFCDQLVSLFFTIIDLNKINCIPIFEELSFRLNKLIYDLNLLMEQYNNDLHPDYGPELG